VTRVLEVTWLGGCNNGAVKRGPNMPLAEPGSHAFAHQARVWIEGGKPCGAWWDDGRPAGDCSPPDMPPRPGKWVRFRTPGIPTALWELAQSRGVEIEVSRAA
jgi:hypothetical protein